VFRDKDSGPVRRVAIVCATLVALSAAAHGLGAGAGASLAPAAQGADKSVWDGVYTEEQAKRGERIFNRQCSYCHGRDLSGTSIPGGPSLREAFLSQWREQTVQQMFATIGETMPKSDPGSLSLQDCVDVVSYILQVNKLPAGGTELPPDPQKLEHFLITDKPPKG